MLKILGILFTIGSFAAVAQAQAAPFQLIGFSDGSVTGDAGVLGMTAECRASFPDTPARMCTSVEISETVTLPALPTGSRGWVRAVIVDPNDATSSSYDALGATLVRGGGCFGWSKAESYGLTVDDSGRFEGLKCDVARSVTCCAPVPLPEPTSMIIKGAGVASLAALSWVKR